MHKYINVLYAETVHVSSKNNDFIKLLTFN